MAGTPQQSGREMRKVRNSVGPPANQPAQSIRKANCFPARAMVASSGHGRKLDAALYILRALLKLLRVARRLFKWRSSHQGPR